MDATDNRIAEGQGLDLAAELETWDWARAAGVSADELRQALQADATPALRKAA